jgi:hypothetical protein
VAASSTVEASVVQTEPSLTVLLPNHHDQGREFLSGVFNDSVCQHLLDLLVDNCLFLVRIAVWPNPERTVVFESEGVSHRGDC